jgi:hypothetical protein
VGLDKAEQYSGLLDLPLSVESELSLDVACRRLKCQLAVLIVRACRPAWLGACLRWLLDWLPADMAADDHLRIPTVAVASVGAAAACGAALAREELVALVLTSAGAG